MKPKTTKNTARKISKQVLVDMRPEPRLHTLPEPPHQGSGGRMPANLPAAQPAGAGTSVSVMAIIERAVLNPRIDVNKMQRLLDMKMKVDALEAEMAFNRAMNTCQSLIPQIEPNKENEHTHSWYATLEAIDTIIKPIYISHGFSISFSTKTLENGNKLMIACVRHIGGHKEYYELDSAVDTSGAKGKQNKTDVQGTGSTATYLQRYLVKLIFNVVIKGEDNDGNRNKKARQQSDFTDEVRAESTDSQIAAFKKDMEAMPTKIERIALIAKEVAFLQWLANNGYESTVDEIHAIADKGGVS